MAFLKSWPLSLAFPLWKVKDGRDDSFFLFLFLFLKTLFFKERPWGGEGEREGSFFPRTINNRSRTGTDKGNPTV